MLLINRYFNSKNIDFIIVAETATGMNDVLRGNDL